MRSATPEELHQRLAMPPPEGPAAFEEILDGLERDVLPFVARISHPGYLAFIPGEGTWPGALGDLIASALNIDTCWWLGASGPSALELVVLDWFRQWVGYPEQAAGVLVSGGSAANLTALACAREARIGVMDEQAVVYMSDQTHSSLARAARALGFRPDQVRVIPTDQRARMRPDALRGAIAADEAAGRAPARWSSPTPARRRSGAVDPFRELSRICREHGDLAARRRRLRGVRLPQRARAARRSPAWSWPTRSRSIRTSGCTSRSSSARCWCATARALRRGFEISPDYLKDIEAAEREVNFSDLGLQLTRTCRALKLWISLRYFGVAAFRAAIDRCLDLALHAAAPDRGLARAGADVAGVARRRDVPPPSARRRRRGGPRADQREPGRADRARGRRLRLDRARARPLRPAAVHPQPLDVAGRGRPRARAGGDAARSIVAAARRPPCARATRRSRRAGCGARRSTRDALRSLPLFASLDDEQAERVLLSRARAPSPWPARRSSSSGRSAGTSTSS